MGIYELLTEDVIQLNIQGTTKEEVMDEMIDLIEKTGALADREAFKEALYNREKQGSTGIGLGIAIPHGKTETVKSVKVAFGQKKTGVDWDSLDGEQTNLIFMIAVPLENAGDEHLKILQLLSRKLMDDAFRNGLLQAQSKEEVRKLIQSM